MRNRNRVKILGTQFFTNAEEGVVVCVMKVDFNVIKHPAFKDMPRWVIASTYATEEERRDCIIVKGIARCSPEDTYNEELGKKIAESKAKAAAFKAAHNFYTEIMADIQLAMAEVEKTKDACAHAMDVESNHIKELSEC